MTLAGSNCEYASGARPRGEKQKLFFEGMIVLVNQTSVRMSTPLSQSVFRFSQSFFENLFLLVVVSNKTFSVDSVATAVDVLNRYY